MTARPDLDAVEALDAVVRHGGFAHAAAALHRVPSAVSYQVAKLEEQLGVKLLDRSGYRVRLTPAGEAVLKEGQKLLAQARHPARMLARRGCQGLAPVVDDNYLGRSMTTILAG